jgi:hypothetical protein
VYSPQQRTVTHYDSAQVPLDQTVTEPTARLFNVGGIVAGDCPRQQGEKDCGAHVAANMLALAANEPFHSSGAAARMAIAAAVLGAMAE